MGIKLSLIYISALPTVPYLLVFSDRWSCKYDPGTDTWKAGTHLLNPFTQMSTEFVIFLSCYLRNLQEAIYNFDMYTKF